MNHIHSYKKRILIVLSIMITALALTGCVSQEKKIVMFDLLKEEGLIDVGDRGWDEYDEIKTVDMSPIPATRTDYIYISGDKTYTIYYRAKTDEREDVNTFTAYVKTECEGKDPVTTVYLFENRKIFKWYWKMYYVGVDE